MCIWRRYFDPPLPKLGSWFKAGFDLLTDICLHEQYPNLVGNVLGIILWDQHLFSLRSIKGVPFRVDFFCYYHQEISQLQYIQRDFGVLTSFLLLGTVSFRVQEFGKLRKVHRPVIQQEESEIGTSCYSRLSRSSSVKVRYLQPSEALFCARKVG